MIDEPGEGDPAKGQGFVASFPGTDKPKVDNTTNNQGFVASFPTVYDGGRFSTKKARELWGDPKTDSSLITKPKVSSDNSKNIPNSKGFEPAKLNSKAIAERWQNIEDLDKEIKKYERYVKGAGGPTSKLGKVYWKTLLRLQSEKDLITDPTLGGKLSRKGWRDSAATSLPIKPRDLNDFKTEGKIESSVLDFSLPDPKTGKRETIILNSVSNPKGVVTAKK